MHLKLLHDTSATRPMHTPMSAAALALACTMAASAVALGCGLEEDVEIEASSNRSAVVNGLGVNGMFINGMFINGMFINGMFINGLSFNSAVANGMFINGLPVNGVPLNGMFINGFSSNGIGYNGLPLNGLAPNGMFINGLPLNGMFINGTPLNGMFINGTPLNGMFINGLPTNGMFINGLSLNGMFINSLPLNGMFINGMFINGLYVDGNLLSDVGLDGLSVNGLTPDTAIKLVDATGELVALTTDQEAAFESVVSHVAACALPEGDALTIYDSDGVAKTYAGYHGLAPVWKTGGLVEGLNTGVDCTATPLIEGGELCPAGIDDNEELRYCLEHYRPVDDNNDVYPGLALNEQQLADLEVVLRYAVSCALAPGDSVSVQFPSGDKHFPGELGLAPEWKDAPLSMTGQKAVSACLAARSNAYGNTVRISLRGPASYPGLAVTAVEQAQFKTHEGAFWGNVFGDSPSLSACAVEGGGPAGRVCTEGQCGFTIPGDCHAVCDERDAAGNWTGCGSDDGAVVLNTFLFTEETLAAGANHTCVRQPGDAAWCWGDNDGGQLGHAGPGGPTPVEIEGLPEPSGSRQLLAGLLHTCSRQRDGRLFCWGDNAQGQLGSSTNSVELTPQHVSALANQVARADSGGVESCALRMDGTAWCWGNNRFGQLGNGNTTNQSAPVQVGDLAQLVDVDTADNGRYGVQPTTAHTCALRMDGSVWCWGSNRFGQLGNGNTSDALLPVQAGSASLGTDAISITVGGEGHTCAIKADRTLWCWGRNHLGQLGDGSTTDRSSPTQVAKLGNDVSEVLAGHEHTCAVTNDGSLWCWGGNDYGQLGDGDRTRRKTPKRVKLPGTAKSSMLGFYSTIALLDDGSVWGWGMNDYGGLGDGTTVERSRPVRVTAMLNPDNGVCDFGESTVYEPQDCPVATEP